MERENSIQKSPKKPKKKQRAKATLFKKFLGTKSLEGNYQPHDFFHFQKLPLLRYRSASPSIEGEPCFVIPTKLGICKKEKILFKNPPKNQRKNKVASAPCWKKNRNR